jgi:hypothetical protein
VKDYRCGARTYDKHDGIDFRIQSLRAQRAGVEVLAAAAGTVARIRDGVPDISIRAPGAPPVAGHECGNAIAITHGGGWETMYCHLAKGSLKVAVGEKVQAGQPVAKVGLSGLTEFPHLHLTVRHNGASVDPFAPGLAEGACEAQGGDNGLWTPQAAQDLAYRRGAILNVGFVGAPIAPAAVEDGALPAAGPAAPFLVAYVRALNLEAGDVLELVIRGPDGVVVVADQRAPLDHAKADFTMTLGKRRPPAGWKPGVYVATYSVVRGGLLAITRTFQTRL